MAPRITKPIVQALAKKKILKSKTVSKISADPSKARAAAAATNGKKIRIGILYGKDFDPVKIGTHVRSYPEKCRVKNNTGRKAEGWGGQFHVDVNSGLKMAQLHPDIFEIDCMTGKEIVPERLKKNHLNLNFWYDPSVARRNTNGKDPKHVKDIDMCHQNPDCRLWPNWDLAHWIAYKPSYMRQCEKAGIPIVPTIYVLDGFRPKEVLKKVQSKGWDKFFVKVGYATFFGEGAIHGKTADFLANPKLLEDFAKENHKHKCFLVQPYMLKANGEVFDEVRNYFVNGAWHTAVFTHGTDESNAGYYEEPKGKRLDAVRELAKRAYCQVQKVAKWQGKPIDTLVSRIDVGVIPDKTAKNGYKVFINEIEQESATWLARYWPTDCSEVVGSAAIRKAHELLSISLESGQHVPDAAMVRQKLQLLEQRLH